MGAEPNDFDTHDGHDAPRVYVSTGELRMVGVCPPHVLRGPWGDPVPYVPPSEDERRALSERVRSAEPELEQPDEELLDEIFSIVVPPLDASAWQQWACGELAADMLRGVVREHGSARFTVALDPRVEDRVRPTFARRWGPSPPPYERLGDSAIELETGEVEDVAFLLGFHARAALESTPTVIVRAGRLRAAVETDLEEGRFYLADPDGALLRHALWSAGRAGYEVVEADAFFFQFGTRERVAALTSWAARAARGTPPPLWGGALRRR